MVCILIFGSQPFASRSSFATMYSTYPFQRGKISKPRSVCRPELITVARVFSPFARPCCLYIMWLCECVSAFVLLRGNENRGKYISLNVCHGIRWMMILLRLCCMSFIGRYDCVFLIGTQFCYNTICEWCAFDGFHVSGIIFPQATALEAIMKERSYCHEKPFSIVHNTRVTLTVTFMTQPDNWHITYFHLYPFFICLFPLDAMMQTHGSYKKRITDGSSVQISNTNQSIHLDFTIPNWCHSVSTENGHVGQIWKKMLANEMI